MYKAHITHLTICSWSTLFNTLKYKHTDKATFTTYTFSFCMYILLLVPLFNKAVCVNILLALIKQYWWLAPAPHISLYSTYTWTVATLSRQLSSFAWTTTFYPAGLYFTVLLRCCCVWQNNHYDKQVAKNTCDRLYFWGLTVVFYYMAHRSWLKMMCPLRYSQSQ